MDLPGCPFCDRVARGDVLARNAHAAAFPDAFPVAEGHLLVVPLRHEPDLFRLPAEEQDAVWRLLREVRAGLGEADGVTVGVNVGAAAGQTVPHAHVHLIPRRVGDVPDPRGGVRWVIPDRAPYWDRRG